jgi:hypothetical protein
MFVRLMFYCSFLKQNKATDHRRDNIADRGEAFLLSLTDQ